MADVRIERVFAASIDTVFRYISQTEQLLEWWGPEGLTVPVHNLDFSHTGPWMSEMHNSEGQIFRVSGEVLRVDPPYAVEVTWAWDDDTGQRGHESRVLIELAADGDKTRFVLTHSGLPDDEAATLHTGGWESSLRKLEKQF